MYKAMSKLQQESIDKRQKRYSDIALVVNQVIQSSENATITIILEEDVE
jgi:hypothetical protein